MRRVKQRPDDLGCGAACVAMITGLTYEQAKMIVYNGKDVRTTGTGQLRAALRSQGYDLPHNRKRLSNNKSPTGKPKSLRETSINLDQDAILSTRAWADGKWHWVVWEAKSKRVLDPDCSGKMPKLYTHYLTVEKV